MEDNIISIQFTVKKPYTGNTDNDTKELVDDIIRKAITYNRDIILSFIRHRQGDSNKENYKVTISFEK